jgi:2-(1,2-epoxy-1,2-dihydrophenyl)acetyl-CoA isomerase
MTYETILFEVSDNVGTITLNRADKLNSFNSQMHADVADVLQRAIADDTIRCLLLTGAGRGFCAGQDLSDRRMDPNDPNAEAPDLGETLDTLYNPLIRAISGMDIPVICAVNGVAAGAGANVALACDIVLAGKSASFIQAFSKLGLVPDAGGTWSMTNRIGVARAKGLALLGEKLPAETAAEWGLIWKCVDDDVLMKTARDMAVGLAKGPTLGYGLTKRAIVAAAHNSLETQLDMERDSQRKAGRSADYREGVNAFMEKRPPVFTGK